MIINIQEIGINLLGSYLWYKEKVTYMVSEDPFFTVTDISGQKLLSKVIFLL